jgi:phospholipid transport system substrate-binding protein
MRISNALSFLGAKTMAIAAGVVPVLSPLSAIPSPTPAPSSDVCPSWRRIVLSSIVGVNLLVAPGDAGATEAGVSVEAGKFITDTVTAGLQILQDPRLDQAQRESRLGALVLQNVDVAGAARFVLGRYWNSSTDMERRRFAGVYRNYIADTYAKALRYIGGTTLKVVRTTTNGNKIEVKTHFIHDRANKPAVCWGTTVYRSEPMCRDADAGWEVDWLLQRVGGGFKIGDVEVDGESLLLNQRDEFASLIGRAGGTVTGLTGIIEARVGAEPSS